MKWAGPSKIRRAGLNQWVGRIPNPARRAAQTGIRLRSVPVRACFTYPPGTTMAVHPVRVTPALGLRISAIWVRAILAAAAARLVAAAVVDGAVVVDEVRP